MNITKAFEALSSGDYIKAKTEFEAAERSGQLKSASDFAAYGLALIENLQFVEADKTLKRALQLDSHSLDALLNQGLLLVRQLNWAAALKHFEMNCRAIEHPLKYRNRGICQLNLASFAEAAKDFAKAAQLDPERTDNYLDWALCELGQKQYEDARDRVEKILKQNSKHLRAQAILKEIQKQQSRS